MKQATEDPEITAIECDVMMGHWDADSMDSREPILAHPPHRESDLKVAVFLSLVTLADDGGNRSLQKHIKLDFKEMDAVQPTLDLISQSNITNPLGKVITLNADILPGPGRRSDQSMAAASFLETCLDYIKKIEVNSACFRI
jgi:hypothetical protein